MEVRKLTLLDLPIDYLAQVLLYLPVRTLLELRVVCSLFRSLIQDDRLWQHKYKLHFLNRRGRRLETTESWLESFKRRVDDDYQNTKIKKCFMAAIDGDLEALKELNLNFEDLFMKSQDNKVLYKTASRSTLNYWYKAIIYPILNEFPEVDEDRSLMHWAVICFQPAKHLEYLAEAGYSINAEDIADCSPLLLAGMLKNKEAVEFFISQKGTTYDGRGDSSPLAFIFLNFPDLGSTLLDRKDISKEIKTDKELLEAATLSGNLSLFKKTLEFSDTNPPSYLLSFAVLSTSLELISYLLNRYVSKGLMNIDIHDTFDSTPLICAAVSGKVKIVHSLLKAGASPNFTDPSRNTPLIMAAELEQISVVNELLCWEETDITATNQFNDSALSLAAKYEHVEILKLLLEKTPSRTKNKLGYNALRDAALFKSKNTFKLLLNSNINLNNSKGITLFECSIRKNEMYIVKMFAESDCLLINKPLRNGKTPVYFAAKYGRAEILEYLLSLPKIKIDSVAENGNTPIMVARLYNHNDCVSLLLKAEKARRNILQRAFYGLFSKSNKNSDLNKTPTCCF